MEGTAPTHGLATARDLAGLDHHEVIDGVVVCKASPTFRHGRIQGKVFAALQDQEVASGGGWWFALEVKIELAQHQVYLPDVAGWRIETMPEEPDPVLSTLHIRPDWVCEVLSPSTSQHDLGAKRAHFCAAGVGHYWLIDPLHGTLTVLRNVGPRYEVVAFATAEDAATALEPFGAVALDPGSLFGRRPPA